MASYSSSVVVVPVGDSIVGNSTLSLVSRSAAQTTLVHHPNEIVYVIVALPTHASYYFMVTIEIKEISILRVGQLFFGNTARPPATHLSSHNIKPMISPMISPFSSGLV